MLQNLQMQVVSSLDDFKSIFLCLGGLSPQTAPTQTNSETASKVSFLLCYEPPGDNVTTELLFLFETRVKEYATQYDVKNLSLHIWNCSSAAFAGAKQQLQKQLGIPLLVIVYNYAVADTLVGDLKKMCDEDLSRVCERIASFQKTKKIAFTESKKCSSEETKDSSSQVTLTVDVAKLVGMGKKLLSERQPFYSLKFFEKALETLDTMQGEERSLHGIDNYEGSVATCLAWAAMASLLVHQSSSTDSGSPPPYSLGSESNIYLKRLLDQPQYSRFCEEPLSDACRIFATHRMMLAAPRLWSAEACSQKKLYRALQNDPYDQMSRTMLVITLFLAGDVERTLTEAVKLRLSGDGFGNVALEAVTKYLGNDHPLLQKLDVMLGNV